MEEASSILEDVTRSTETGAGNSASREACSLSFLASTKNSAHSFSVRWCTAAYSASTCRAFLESLAQTSRSCSWRSCCLRFLSGRSCSLRYACLSAGCEKSSRDLCSSSEVRLSGTRFRSGVSTSVFAFAGREHQKMWAGAYAGEGSGKRPVSANSSVKDIASSSGDLTICMQKRRGKYYKQVGGGLGDARTEHASTSARCQGQHHWREYG